MANTNTTTGKITPGNAVGMGASDVDDLTEKADNTAPKQPDMEVKLTKKMQAELDLPQKSTEPATKFPDNSKRKESGFEETLA